VLSHLVRREVKLRYKASVIGFFWSFLRPLSMMIILSLVFSVLLRFPIPYELSLRWDAGWTRASYPIFLLVGLLPWIFTINSLNDAVYSMLNNAALIRKVSMPSEIFPMASVLANLVNFFFSMAVFLPILFFLFSVPVHWGLCLLPFVLLVQFILTLGIAFIISLGNCFFRDVSLIFEQVGMMWFYLTPVFYPFEYVLHRFMGQREWVSWIYLANPMASLVQLYRWILLRGSWGESPPPWAAWTTGQWIAAGVGFTLWPTLAICIGIGLFQKYRKTIPDEL
jgi:lipopolysaccharide transport system permease protein